MKQPNLVFLVLLVLCANIGFVRGQDRDDHPIITSANATQVTQLAQLGGGKVTATAWSADAKTLVVATSLAIYIYRFGESMPQMLEKVGYTSRLALSDNGRFLVAYTTNLRAWNLETGNELSLTGMEPTLMPLSFFPGSENLVADAGDELQVWDFNTGELFKRVSANFGPVSSISPDMRHIIGFWKGTGSGGEYITINVGDGATGKLISNSMVAEGPWIIAYAFNPVENNHLAVVHRNGVVRLWNIDTGELLYTLALPDGLVSTIAFSSDGQILATGGIDGKVRLWEASTGVLLKVFSNQLDKIQRLVFDTDGQLIAFNGNTHEARAWDARTLYPLASFTFSSALLPALLKVSFDAQDEQVIAVGMDGTIHFWEIASEQEIAVWNAYEIAPDQQATLAGYNVDLSTTFSGDRKYLARLDRQTGALYLWELADGSEPSVLQTPATQGGNSLVFSGDNRWLVFSAGFGNLLAWGFDENMTPKVESVLLPNYDSWIYANIAFSPTEPIISYLQDNKEQFGDARLYLQNVETGDVRFIADVRRVGSNLIFNPSGSLLAVRQADKLKFWNTHTGAYEYEINICGEASAFSPDGSLILVSCGLGLELYDARSGEKLTTLVGHTASIEAAAFNAAGSLIVTTGHDGTVRLWGIG